MTTLHKKMYGTIFLIFKGPHCKTSSLSASTLQQNAASILLYEFRAPVQFALLPYNLATGSILRANKGTPYFYQTIAPYYILFQNC